MKANGIIDFHAHILPRADHGSDSLETTKKQLLYLKRCGVCTVVATPHFYPQRDNVDTFLKRREESWCRLKSEITEDMPRVLLGAEVLVCSGIDHMPGIERLCVEGTEVILLEMPMGPWRDEHIEAVRRISRLGLTVVMAHIDRYREEEVARLCEDCDVLYQLNGETQSTLAGRRRAYKISRTLPVVAVGSDIHGADKRAAKNLVRLAERLKKSGIDTCESSLALLDKIHH